MMKPQFLLIMFTFILSLACQHSTTNSAGMLTNAQTPKEVRNSMSASADEYDLWVPTAIEACIAAVDVAENFKFEADFNPFYLRVDFDGNSSMDYAVLVKGESSQNRGVIICKDSEQPFVFGALSRPKTSFSTFENDNFVTNQWEVLSKDETKMQINILKNKISPNAKGESIVFMFEGGTGVHIFWNGESFQIRE